jgi:hypothetical protein
MNTVLKSVIRVPVNMVLNYVIRDQMKAVHYIDGNILLGIQ